MSARPRSVPSLCNFARPFRCCSCHYYTGRSWRYPQRSRSRNQATTAGRRTAHSGHPAAAVQPLSASIADSVRLGILAAAGADQGTTAESACVCHHRGPAADPRRIPARGRAGARAVIGPLTRNGVTSLAYSGIVSVPTLALNMPEGEILLPRDLYVFGLQSKRKPARWRNSRSQPRGHRVLSSLPGDTRPGQPHRAGLSLENGAELKGKSRDSSLTRPSPRRLAKLREQAASSPRPTSYSCTMGATRVRFIRSYLGGSLPIYATSHGVDLECGHAGQL